MSFLKKGSLRAAGKRAALTLSVLVLLTAVSWPVPNSAHAADKVSIRLLWMHQAQFAGWYMAKDEGIFTRYGLDVEIKPGGPGISPVEDLLNGGSDFALMWLAAGIESRCQGKPVMHLAQFIQRSGTILVALENSGVESIKDLEGARVSLWDSYFSLAARAMFKRQGIEIKEVLQGKTMALLLEGAVLASAAMTYNEYHRLYQTGINYEDLVVFNMSDLGYNFPEDGLYTTKAMWQKKPDVCKRLTLAVLDGWRMAFAHPKKALASVMKRVDRDSLGGNPSHQLWMLETLRDLMTHNTTDDKLGRLKPKDYHTVSNTLLRQGFVCTPPSIDDFSAQAWRRSK